MNQSTPGSGIHPAPAQFSAEQLSTDPILHFFHYDHLPAALQSISAPFCGLAAHLVDTLPRNAERTVALRKLLEAKDCAVRANVGAMASGGSEIDRLKLEQSQLQARIRKLTLDSAGDALVDQQAVAMGEYLAILTARIENMEHAAGLGQAREVGGHDEDRDGPLKFRD